MEKLVYVLWSPDDRDAFSYALRKGAAAKLVERGCRGLSLDLSDSDVRYAEGNRLTRLEQPPAGMASFWLDAADDRGPFEEVLATHAERMAGYLVAESVPLHNTTHTAPLGARTPGTTMLALLERPERLAWEEWVRIWHGPHRTVALETQSTYLYVRNLVVRALTKDAPPWEGIVQEGFPTEAVTNPKLWYDAGDSEEKLKENLGRMIASCQAFLDLDRVESHPMSEYRIQEPV